MMTRPSPDDVARVVDLCGEWRVPGGIVAAFAAVLTETREQAWRDGYGHGRDDEAEGAPCAQGPYA
jgi:hypothetical protein